MTPYSPSKFPIRRNLLACLCLLALAWPCRGAEEEPDEPKPMPPRYERWLNRDVRWIISDAERSVFLSLENNEQRDRFIARFWEVRDPSPGTQRNEFKREHYKRLEYAERQLGRDTPRPGYETDRGRVYILLGEPNDRKFFFSTAYNTYPIELWFYQAPDSWKDVGMPPFFYVLFFKRRGVGEYKLYSPIADGPERLVGGSPMKTLDRSNALVALEGVNRELAQASLSLIPGESVDYFGGGTSTAAIASEMLLGRIHDMPNRLVNPRYLDGFSGHQGETQSEVAFVQFEAPIDTFFTVDRANIPWLHVSITVPPDKLTLASYEDRYAANLNLVGVVEQPDGRTIEWLNEPVNVDLDRQQFARVHASPMSVETLIPVIAGRHTLRLILRNEVTGQFGVAEQEIEMPQRPTQGILLTQPLLAYRIDRVEQPPASAPFLFAGLKFSPASGGRFARGETAFTYFQIQYPADSPPGRLRKTLSLMRDGDEVSGQMGFFEPHPDEDRGLMHVVEELKIASVPPGSYRLEVRITNDQGELMAETSAPVEVTLDPVPRPWTFVRSVPMTDTLRRLARQHRAAGSPEAAVQLLEHLLKAQPADAALKLELAQVLIGLGRHHEALEQLEPLTAAEGSDNWLAQSLKGAVLVKLGRYSEAVGSYELAIKALGPQPRLLNALGEAKLKAGDKEGARAAFTRSLQVDAEQPQVIEALEIAGGTPPEPHAAEPAP
jgi:GWxTD domain-containing protein